MEVPLTPLALAERGFEAFPDRAAVIDDGMRRTYRDLLERVTRLAGALRALGVGPGERVALLAPNTAEALEAYTGVLLAGAVLVPVNTRLSPEEIAYILRHSESRILLADASLSEACAALRERLPDLPQVVQGGDPPPGVLAYERLLTEATPVPWASDAVAETDLATLNYTSGTTARPKGVGITHRGAMLNAVNMVFALSLTRDDVHLHVAPMFHANGWGFVWATLAAGAANVPMRHVDGAAVLDRVRRFGVTRLCAAPTVLRMILDAASKDPGDVPAGVRLATAGGAPPAAVIRRVEERLRWRITHLYGLTETTAFVTGCEEPAELSALDADGRYRFKARQGIPLVLAGRVACVAPDGRPVRPDGVETGEVVARGNVVMAGYHKDPDATRAAIRDGWFHTGDVAVRHPDGYLEVRDRLKDVIKSGGEEIASVEVEGVLAAHPDVADAAVVAGPHPHWGETPVAFVVLRAGTAPSAGALTAFCRDRLAHFKVPSRFVFVADLPRTASGKVRKAVLRARLAGEAAPGAPAPQ